MTHFALSLLFASALVLGPAGCAVDGTETDDSEVGTEEPTEDSPEVAQLAQSFNAGTNAHLQSDGTVQFWCDKQLKDSGTSVDNETFPCSTYTMEYGSWVAGC